MSLFFIKLLLILILKLSIFSKHRGYITNFIRIFRLKNFKIYYIVYILYIGKDFVYLFEKKELIKDLFLILNGLLILFTIYDDLVNSYRTQYIPYRTNIFMKK